jgi:hypothetical protein
VNPEETEYKLQSCYKEEGQMHSINTANWSSEDVAMFKYLGTTLTDENCMHKDIKSRLNSGNAFYYSVQSLLSSCLLPEALYECETWSLALREEHRMRVFEKMVLRRIFGPKRDKVTGEWRKLHSEELHIL